jgi:hypothetical protein
MNLLTKIGQFTNNKIAFLLFSTLFLMIFSRFVVFYTLNYDLHYKKSPKSDQSYSESSR